MKPPYARLVTRKTRKNPYPYAWVTRTLRTGTGFCGYGYGLPWDTPGLPVIIPNENTNLALGEHTKVAGYGSDAKGKNLPESMAMKE
jgi:hypothetical protein